jgi:hypothetical protein
MVILNREYDPAGGTVNLPAGFSMARVEMPTTEGAIILKRKLFSMVSLIRGYKALRAP